VPQIDWRRIMTTPANIHQQISWMKDQLAHMKAKLPIGVRNGTISQEHADGKFAAAEATLRTLEAIRAISLGKEVANA